MKKLITELLRRLACGEEAVLCTILASSGSAPRGAGARMAVFADGTTLGTVGGGTVEYLATQEAIEILHDKAKTCLRAFSLTTEQINSVGMICGGNVSVFYQRVTEQTEPTLRRILAALDTEADSWLYLRFRGGETECFSVVTGDEAAREPTLFTSRAVLRQGEPSVYAEPLLQAGRVYVFGGGHVGQALIPALKNVDFRVTLFDNRRELADAAHFPSADRVIFGDYDNIFDHVTLTPRDYVVIMTPGHQSDRALLQQVLRVPLRYVGCIGSRSKIARTQELLREAGISEEAIASVHSPIGLPILAQTPAEIAVSITAELIRVRAETR